LIVYLRMLFCWEINWKDGTLWPDTSYDRIVNKFVNICSGLATHQILLTINKEFDNVKLISEVRKWGGVEMYVWEAELVINVLHFVFRCNSVNITRSEVWFTVWESELVFKCTCDKLNSWWDVFNCW
jgi:hypothetical protein